MHSDDEKLARVTAKLTDGFYVGQRVRWQSADEIVIATVVEAMPEMNTVVIEWRGPYTQHPHKTTVAKWALEHWNDR